MDEQQIKTIIEGVNKSLDTKLGEAFHAIDQRLEAHTNANLAAHEEHRKAIGAVRANLITLWRHVRGPKSNPPTDGGSPSLPPPPRGLVDVAREAEAKASQADLELDALRAEMVVGFASLEEKLDTKVDALHTKQDKQTEHLETLANVAKHPLAKQLAIALVTAALTWLGMHAEPPKTPTIPQHAETK